MAPLDWLCHATWGGFMIRIQPIAEPHSFDVDVRQPGARFLRSTPNPLNFRSHSYWSRIRNNLYNCYNKICAYSGCRIITDDTIDHFLPKIKYPEFAYEWSNYRLCSSRINQCKGNDENIVDPFYIEDGWFQLLFPSCLVISGSNLPQHLKARIDHTIEKLKLNSNQWLDYRCETALAYARKEMTFDRLKRTFPFLAAEICRQNLCDNICTLFPNIDL